MKFPIDEIWIDAEAEAEPLTREILARLPRARVFVGDRVRLRSRNLDLEPDPFRRGKRILKLVKHRGAFVKPCPGTPAYVCCGLEILHIGQGCPMDCRYCALQVYLNRPVLEVFVNTEDLFAALGTHLDAHSGRMHRICTGEFTDSLALDPLSGLARELVVFFASRADASLEIKTKTDFVDSLLDVDPRGRVVLSFSVNTATVTRSDELRAAPLERRLAAARRAAAAGYRLGFHFDPIIPLPGWEDAYRETVDAIYRAVDPDSIAWISLGVLRFVPQLKEIAEDRFGPIRYYHDSFLQGLDGKSRLPVDVRIRVYRRLAENIRGHSPDARIYLCMESPQVWVASLGLAIRSDGDLASYLDAAVT
jgi:spore photoproduct lyase